MSRRNQCFFIHFLGGWEGLFLIAQKGPIALEQRKERHKQGDGGALLLLVLSATHSLAAISPLRQRHGHDRKCSGTTPGPRLPTSVSPADLILVGQIITMSFHGTVECVASIGGTGLITFIGTGRCSAKA